MVARICAVFRCARLIPIGRRFSNIDRKSDAFGDPFPPKRGGVRGIGRIDTPDMSKRLIFMEICAEFW
jgi:hypothetical protein